MGAAGDARRLVVAKEQKAAGLPASSDVTLTWPGVVTNEDTWADSGTGSTGEFAYTSGTGLHYVQLDLGAAYTVDQIKVWHYARDGRTYHNTKTQVSADGSTWVTVFDSAVSGEYAETAAGKTHTFSPRSVRYVRDWLNGSTSNSGNHWVEIEVWGTRTRVYAGQHYEKNINSGEVTKYYHFGGSRVAMRRGSVVQYLLADHLGSTALTLNSSGSKVGELRYKAYGETRYTWGTTPTDYRFTGQRQTESLGLYHMGARWYDPYLGRWLSPDSIVPEPGNLQSLNRYSFVLGNPVKFRDSSGHCAEGEDAGECDPDLTLELLNMDPEGLYWYLHNTNSDLEILLFGVGGLFIVSAGGVVFVEGGTALAEAVGAERVASGIFNAGGYVVGSLLSGEKINVKDLGLAFGAGTVIPGGSGAHWLEKAAKGAFWGATNNAAQSTASQVIDMATGEQEDFSFGDLTVNAVTGGVSGVLGDPVSEKLEPYVESASRGVLRGSSNWIKAGVDGFLSWFAGLFGSD